MTYILLLAILAGGGRPAVFTVEFNTLSACQAASIAINKQAKESSSFGVGIAVCAAKGAPK